MHFLHKISIPFIVFIILNNTLRGTCDEITQKKIAETSPFLLYRLIDTTKSGTFNDSSFIEKGLKRDASAHEWDSLIECCHLMTLHEVKHKKAPSLYEDSLSQLNAASDFINHTVSALHKKYAALFKKKKNLFALFYTQIPVSEKSYLENIKKQLNEHSKILHNIIRHSLKTIDQGTKISAEWQKNVPQSLDIIFPQYKKFFKSYVKANNQGAMTPLQLLYFLQITKTLQAPLLKNRYKKEIDKAAAFVDVLDQFIYRLQEDIKQSNSASTINEKKKLLAASQEIIQKLSTLYPHMVTNVYFVKLPLTNDKASIVLYAEATVLMNLIETITEEVNFLLTNIKNEKENT